ncbi:hypothetical protein [Paenibacillus montaniterrae]|nr:hypothetical protein [Paenibacillus montaniterrae]
MLGSISMIAVALLIAVATFPALWKAKQRKEIVVASIILIVAVISGVGYLNKLVIFNPIFIIRSTFEPIGRAISDLFQA